MPLMWCLVFLKRCKYSHSDVNWFIFSKYQDCHEKGRRAVSRRENPEIMKLSGLMSCFFSLPGQINGKQPTASGHNPRTFITRPPGQLPEGNLPAEGVSATPPCPWVSRGSLCALQPRRAAGSLLDVCLDSASLTFLGLFPVHLCPRLSGKSDS